MMYKNLYLYTLPKLFCREIGSSSRKTNFLEETELISKYVRIYGEVFQIGKQFSNLFANALVSCLFSACSLQLVCTSQLFMLTIKGGSVTTTETQISIFYVLVIMNAIVVLISLFGLCGQVHYESSNCLDKLKIRIHKNPKLLQKYMRIFKSLARVKVEFGKTNNFVEKCTPVIYQQFTVQRILDYILVTYKNRK